MTKHSILYELGEYGPALLILLSWWLLWGRENLFFYYTVGLAVNIVINLLLKGMIQEPRPMFDTRKVRILKTHGKSYFFQNGIPFDVFGMPSGHAQTVFYSTAFLWLSLKEWRWMYVCLPLSLLTCYQRVEYLFHTFSQVVVGSIAGIAIARGMYQLGREKMKNKIREKSDDYGPI